MSIPAHTQQGALVGVRVVDFTRIFAGPFTTQILGDLGADVIKIERTDGGDEARDYGVMDRSQGPGAPFLALNRNKRSVAIDLKHQDGRRIALRLVENADVVVHNYRPGVMERLGLDYGTISARRPATIYCAISGFGNAGRLRERAANDLSIQAYSGLLSITGEPDGPPVRNPASVSDYTAGLYATIGILAAITHRERTGQGQEIETSLLEGSINMLNHFYVDYWRSGTVPQRLGTGHRLGLPNQAFPTSDGWVCITTPNERSWQECARVLEIGHLADDPRFSTLAARYRHRPELVELVTEATRRFSTAECMTRLEQGGVPCAPVNSIPGMAADPQLAALGSVVEMNVKDVGPVKLVSNPLHFSKSPTSARLPPPLHAEHTDEVLREVGYPPAEIARLREGGVIR